MSGFVQKREDKPIVPDHWMKRQTAENIHERLAI
jgi:hypothetical protein